MDIDTQRRFHDVLCAMPAELVLHALFEAFPHEVPTAHQGADGPRHCLQNHHWHNQSLPKLLSCRLTAEGSLSAQWEHTVVVTRDGCEILTRLSPAAGASNELPQGEQQRKPTSASTYKRPS